MSKNRPDKEAVHPQEIQTELDAYLLEIERWKKRFTENEGFHGYVIGLVNKICQ